MHISTLLWYEDPEQEYTQTTGTLLPRLGHRPSVLGHSASETETNTSTLACSHGEDMMVYGLEQDPTLNDGNRIHRTFGYAECIAITTWGKRFAYYPRYW